MATLQDVLDALNQSISGLSQNMIDNSKIALINIEAQQRLQQIEDAKTKNFEVLKKTLVADLPTKIGAAVASKAIGRDFTTAFLNKFTEANKDLQKQFKDTFSNLSIEFERVGQMLSSVASKTATSGAGSGASKSIDNLIELTKKMAPADKFKMSNELFALRKDLTNLNKDLKNGNLSDADRQAKISQILQKNAQISEKAKEIAAKTYGEDKKIAKGIAENTAKLANPKTGASKIFEDFDRELNSRRATLSKSYVAEFEQLNQKRLAAITAGDEDEMKKVAVQTAELRKEYEDRDKMIVDDAIAQQERLYASFGEYTSTFFERAKKKSAEFFKEFFKNSKEQKIAGIGDFLSIDRVFGELKLGDLIPSATTKEKRQMFDAEIASAAASQFDVGEINNYLTNVYDDMKAKNNELYETETAEVEKLNDSISDLSKAINLLASDMKATLAAAQQSAIATPSGYTPGSINQVVTSAGTASLTSATPGLQAQLVAAGSAVVPFAEGGIVTKKTNALIGETGEKEAIVPLSKIGDFVDSISSEPKPLDEKVKSVGERRQNVSAINSLKDPGAKAAEGALVAAASITDAIDDKQFDMPKTEEKGSTKKDSSIWDWILSLLGLLGLGLLGLTKPIALLKGVFGALKEWLEKIFPSLADLEKSTKGLWNAFKDSFDDIFNAKSLKELADNLVSFFKNGLDFIKMKSWSRIASMIEDFFENGLGSILKRVWPSAGDSVTNFFKNIAKNAEKQVLKNSEETFAKRLARASESGSAADKQAAQRAMDSMVENLKRMSKETIADELPKMKKMLADASTDFQNLVSRGVGKEGAEAFKDEVEAAAENLSRLQGAIDGLESSLARGAESAAKGGIGASLKRGIGASLKRGIGKVGEHVFEGMGGSATTWKGAMKAGAGSLDTIGGTYFTRGGGLEKQAGMGLANVATAGMMRMAPGKMPGGGYGKLAYALAAALGGATIAEKYTGIEEKKRRGGQLTTGEKAGLYTGRAIGSAGLGFGLMDYAKTGSSSLKAMQAAKTAGTWTGATRMITGAMKGLGPLQSVLGIGSIAARSGLLGKGMVSEEAESAKEVDAKWFNATQSFADAVDAFSWLGGPVGALAGARASNMIRAVNYAAHPEVMSNIAMKQYKADRELDRVAAKPFVQAAQNLSNESRNLLNQKKISDAEFAQIQMAMKAASGAGETNIAAIGKDQKSKVFEDQMKVLNQQLANLQKVSDPKLRKEATDVLLASQQKFLETNAHQLDKVIGGGSAMLSRVALTSNASAEDKKIMESIANSTKIMSDDNNKQGAIISKAIVDATTLKGTDASTAAYVSLKETIEKSTMDDDKKNSLMANLNSSILYSGKVNDSLLKEIGILNKNNQSYAENSRDFAQALDAIDDVSQGIFGKGASNLVDALKSGSDEAILSRVTGTGAEAGQYAKLEETMIKNLDDSGQLDQKFVDQLKTQLVSQKDFTEAQALRLISILQKDAADKKEIMVRGVEQQNKEQAKPIVDAIQGKQLAQNLKDAVVEAANDNNVKKANTESTSQALESTPPPVDPSQIKNNEESINGIDKLNESMVQQQKLAEKEILGNDKEGKTGSDLLESVMAEDLKAASNLLFGEISAGGTSTGSFSTTEGGILDSTAVNPQPTYGNSNVSPGSIATPKVSSSIPRGVAGTAAIKPAVSSENINNNNQDNWSKMIEVLTDIAKYSKDTSQKVGREAASGGAISPTREKLSLR